MAGLKHVWRPLGGFDRAMRQWFAESRSDSRFNFGAPVLTVIGDRGINAETAALSDADVPSSIGFCVRDLDQRYTVGFSVTLFGGQTDAFDSYEACLRIDCRPLPYYEAVGSVYPWWRELGYHIPDPPAAASDPLYSSWYNFHQAPDGERLIEELTIASELGFRTVILDDGWQFPGPSCGDYSMCGEWTVSPDKFADFKAFCDSVHSLGMKLAVWFAVPFVGVKSPLFGKFEGKYLSVDHGLFNAGVLDIRRPEVREYIIGNYRRFVEDYGVDGFKFDFIDAFAETPDSPPYSPGEMDCAAVGDAVKKLLTEIDTELGRIKPGLMYEYRQCYIGPGINRFGNMLRVGDCAYEPLTNRVGICDLRLLGYPVAVHSDMLYWSPAETPLLCAGQLMNIMFAVPQISVLLTENTPEQKKLLKDYISYWTENKSLLLGGSFRPLRPESNYPAIVADGGGRQIAVLHGERLFTYEKPCDVHLDSDEDGLIIENPTGYTLKASLYTSFGGSFAGETDIPARGTARLPLPRMGMARIGPRADD